MIDHRLHLRRRATLALFLAFAPLACAHSAEALVHSGAEGGVGGSLEGLSDPHNKELLRRLLQDPGIQKAAHDLSAALSSGLVDGLTESERLDRVNAASDAYVRTVAAALGDALDHEISPAVARGVKAALTAALDPAQGRLAQGLVDGVTRSAIVAFTESAAHGVRDDLGPAISQLLVDDLGPAVQTVLEVNLGPALRKVIADDLQPALDVAIGGEDGGTSGAFARALTRQIVLGANDGMSELGISLSPNREDGIGVSGWLLLVLGALLLALFALLLRLGLTSRSMARDRTRSEEMLVNILRAIKSPGGEGQTEAPDLDTVIARVHSNIADFDSGDAYLAKIVGRAQLPERPAAASTPGKRAPWPPKA